MSDDWEDDMWEYSQGGNFNDEDDYADEPKGEGDEEGEYEESDGGFDEDVSGGGEEDMEFSLEYKQLQQVSFERRSSLGTVGLSEGVQKSQRTPEEATLDQVEGVISSTYSDMTDVLRQKIITHIEKIKGVYLYNVEVLVLSSIWVVEGRELNKKNFSAFMDKYKSRTDVNVLDVIRYIRTLSLK